MKRLNLLSGILMAIAMTLSFSACSDNNDPAPTPDPDPQPELSDYHFDIFMTIGCDKKSYRIDCSDTDYQLIAV